MEETQQATTEEEIQVKDSYVNIPGSWDTRKISLWGVAWSVISQLQVGIDLTKVMLPADFQAPYSLLELCAARYLGYWHIIKELYHQQDPLLRLIVILRWFLAGAMDTKQERKPYNSDLNETHTAILDTATYYAQQVSHHPPITAFTIIDKGGIQIIGNFGADTRFHGNSVTAETAGFLEINYNGETYKVPKAIPSMAINNVIWGTRTIHWIGELSIECEQSSYVAKLTFEGDYYGQTVVKGNIYKNQEGSDLIPLYNFEGLLGKADLNLIPTDKGLEPISLLTSNNLHKVTQLFYPNKMDPMETLNIWKEMTHYIIKEDLIKADEANHKRRTKAHMRAVSTDPQYQRNYFIWDEAKARYIFNPSGIPESTEISNKTKSDHT